MGALDFFLLTARLALLLAGLLLPGAALLRALRLPWSLGASVVGSSVILYASLLLLALSPAPITLLSLSLLLATATFVGVAVSLRVRPKDAQPPAPPDGTHSFAAFTRLGWWTPLYAAFWAIVVWRLSTQPLTGADVNFRWAWLAEQISRLGSLDFYPPRTASGFSLYAWPESIPPGIASLHTWAFLCGGSTRALWTSPAILLQFVALHEFIWRLAFSWGGDAAARRAVLLAAATPLLTWGSIIGQETGLTALAVTALLFGLLRWHKTRETGWLILAALSAVAGASAREYGPAFPLLGLGVLALMRASRRVWLTFAAVAIPLAAVWPLRTWALTDNPFYALNVAGLFPTNSLFASWSAHFHAGPRQALFTLDAWSQISRYLVLFAPAAVFGGLALLLHTHRGLREARWCLACAATVTALWLASLPFTAGGLFYALRVLAPAFALAAAFGGYAILAASTPVQRCLDAALLIALLGTLPHTLTLPENAYRATPQTWPDAARGFEKIGLKAEADLLAALRALPHQHHPHILTDFAGLPHVLKDPDLRAIPLWSPEVAWLFDPSLPAEKMNRRWRTSGIRYLVTSPAPAFLEFITRQARWRSPTYALNAVWQSDAYLILEVIIEPEPAR